MMHPASQMCDSNVSHGHLLRNFRRPISCRILGKEQPLLTQGRSSSLQIVFTRPDSHSITPLPLRFVQPSVEISGMVLPARPTSASQLQYDPGLTIRPKSAADIDDDLFSEADMTWLLTSGASDDVHFSEPLAPDVISQVTSASLNRPLASPVYSSLTKSPASDPFGRFTPGTAGMDSGLPGIRAWTVPQLQFPNRIAAAASASPIQLLSLQTPAISPARGSGSILSSESLHQEGSQSSVWQKQEPLHPVPVRFSHPFVSQLDTPSTLLSAVFALQDNDQQISIPPRSNSQPPPSYREPLVAQTYGITNPTLKSVTQTPAVCEFAAARVLADLHHQHTNQPSFSQLPATDSPSLSNCLLELKSLAAARKHPQQQPQQQQQKPQDPPYPSNLHPTLISQLDSHALLFCGSIEDSFEFTRDLGLHELASLASDGHVITTTPSPLSGKRRSQSNLLGMVDMLSFGFSNVSVTQYDASSMDHADANLPLHAGRSPSLLRTSAETSSADPVQTGHVEITSLEPPSLLINITNGAQILDRPNQSPLFSSSKLDAPTRSTYKHRTSDSSTATTGSSDSCGVCNSGCSLRSESGSSHDGKLNRSVTQNLQLSGSAPLDAYLSSLIDSDSSREFCVSWAYSQLHARGCQAISSLLGATASVRVLSLTHCLITDNDVAELIPGLLMGPSCIAILDLSHNMIGDHGIRELSLCLSKTSTLEMLQLSHNRIGDSGATVLASAARRCPSLAHLHLQGNSGVGAAALKLIATALSSAKRRRRNSTLGFFDIIPGNNTSAGQAGEQETGLVEQNAAALAFGTRSRFASSSCGQEEETILQLLLRPTSSAELLVTGLVRQIVGHGPAQSVLQAEGLGAHALAQQLTSHGVQAAVVAALGSGTGGSCLRNLRHQYVTCSIPSTAPALPDRASSDYHRGSIRGGQVIVDPTFRDSFEISVMTPAYRKLLEQIPDVLVAATHRLPLVVQFLCDRMHEAFLEHKVTVPPWREATSIMTKYGASTI